MAETQNNLLRGWETLRTNQIKLNFFNKCKEKHVIPNGLKVNFNLAVGCNNEVLVNKIQNLKRSVVGQINSEYLHPRTYIECSGCKAAF